MWWVTSLTLPFYLLPLQIESLVLSQTPTLPGLSSGWSFFYTWSHNSCLLFSSHCAVLASLCKHASKTPLRSIVSMNLASYWCEEESKQPLVTGNKSTMKIILLIQPNNTLLSAYLTFFTMLNLMWQVTQVLKAVRLYIRSLIKENYGFQAVVTTIWEEKPIKKGPKKWGPNTESKICFILQRC